MEVNYHLDAIPLPLESVPLSAPAHIHTSDFHAPGEQRTSTVCGTCPGDRDGRDGRDVLCRDGFHSARRQL